MDLSALEKISLKSGAHDPGSNEFCVMEAVAFVAGEKWSDHPECACPVIAGALRNWNDSLKTDEERDRLLKPLIPLLVGTRGTKEDERRRSYMAVDWLIRVYTPKWLRLIPALVAVAEQLEATSEIKDDAGLPLALIKEAKEAAAAAWDAARDAAWAAARDAAWAAAWAAARDAAWAAAWAAARDAAWAALKKPKEELQVSATELFRRMCEGMPEGGAS